MKPYRLVASIVHGRGKLQRCSGSPERAPVDTEVHGRGLPDGSPRDAEVQLVALVLLGAGGQQGDTAYKGVSKGRDTRRTCLVLWSCWVTKPCLVPMCCYVRRLLAGGSGKMGSEGQQRLHPARARRQDWRRGAGLPRRLTPPIVFRTLRGEGGCSAGFKVQRIGTQHLEGARTRRSTRGRSWGKGRRTRKTLGV
jgi:hypothetical protein